MKKILALILSLILALSLLVACGSSDGGASGDRSGADYGGDSGTSTPSETPTIAEDEEFVIGCAFAGVDLGFFSTVWDGVLDEANAIGNVELILLVAENDANKQNDQIRSLIAQEVDAIIIVPVDGSVVVSAVIDAQAAGIPVVMANRPLQSDEVVAEISVLSDNYAMAYNQMVWLAEDARKTGDEYNILLLIGGLADENAVLRRDGHYKAIEENSDVLTLVVDVPTNWQSEMALQGVQNSMQAYDNINCIVTPADGFTVPIQSALEQINKWVPRGEPGHITIVSFDGDSRAMERWDGGFLTCTAVQDAYGQGRNVVAYAVRLAQGETFTGNEVVMDAGFVLTYVNYDEMHEKVWGWAVYQSLKDA